MKKLFVLLGLIMIAASAANAGTGTEVPGAISAFFDVILNIIIEKGILLAGVGIIIVGGILGFTNKSWSPFVYAVVAVILMALAKPTVLSLIASYQNASF